MDFRQLLIQFCFNLIKIEDRKNFEKICSIIELGILRERKDGILEYSINKTDNLKLFLASIKPFLILKKKQAELMLKILANKEKVGSQKDFNKLAQLIDQFRELNYSKKRKIRILTPQRLDVDYP